MLWLGGGGHERAYAPYTRIKWRKLDVIPKHIKLHCVSVYYEQCTLQWFCGHYFCRDIWTLYAVIYITVMYTIQQCTLLFILDSILHYCSVYKINDKNMFYLAIHQLGQRKSSEKSLLYRHDLYPFLVSSVNLQVNFVKHYMYGPCILFYITIPVLNTEHG